MITVKLKENNPPGEGHSLSVNESEVIIELGAEGGSITLSRFRTERGWSFSREVTDCIDEEWIQHKSAQRHGYFTTRARELA